MCLSIFCITVSFSFVYFFGQNPVTFSVVPCELLLICDLFIVFFIVVIPKRLLVEWLTVAPAPQKTFTFYLVERRYLWPHILFQRYTFRRR